MVDLENKETKDKVEEEVPGTLNTEKKKRKRHSREENRSRECSNSSSINLFQRKVTQRLLN